MRMSSEKTFLDSDVKRYVLPSSANSDYVSPEYLKIQNELKNVLVPVQIVITKSKDDGRGAKRYCLFCKQNLKIYDTVDQYLKDAPTINRNTQTLKADLNQLVNSPALADKEMFDQAFNSDEENIPVLDEDIFSNFNQNYNMTDNSDLVEESDVVN